MLTEHLFARDEVAPSWWANVLGEALSLGAFGFQLTLQDPTHLQVIAGAGDQAAAIPIHGRWRWIEATINRAHPGGGLGTYDIYVTAAENNIVNVPDPYTDATNRAFALAIVVHGTTPNLVAGVVDIFRYVGSCQWSGTAITRIDQTIPAIPRHKNTHATGQPDALVPADIGAAAAADLTTEANARLTADSTEIAARVTAVSNEASARAAADTAESTARLNAWLTEAATRAAQVPPVGAQMPYTGQGDPGGGGVWVIADGRLIDKTTYAAFFAATGHAYNGGVDPLGNKVKIPDKRGRKSIGAINMGSGAGIGPNDNAHAQGVVGDTGGEVLHITLNAEMPTHSHTGTSGNDFPDHRHGIFTGNPGIGADAAIGNTAASVMDTGYPDTHHAHSIPSDGGSTGHNNVDPFQSDSWIVRIA